MKYWIYLNNEKSGPYSAEQLIIKAIPPTTLVWCDGMPSWMPAGEIPELAPIYYAPQPPKLPHEIPPPYPCEDVENKSKVDDRESQEEVLQEGSNEEMIQVADVEQIEEEPDENASDVEAEPDIEKIEAESDDSVSDVEEESDVEQIKAESDENASDVEEEAVSEVMSPPVYVAQQQNVAQVSLPQPQASQSSGMPPHPDVKCPPTYLVWAILTTLCCCQPFGIVAIIYAANVESKYNRGDVEGAINNSEKAALWVILAFVIGMATLPLQMLLSALFSV